MQKDKIAPYLFFPSPAAERDGKKNKKQKTKRIGTFLSTPLLLLACRQLTPWLGSVSAAPAARLPAAASFLRPAPSWCCSSLGQCPEVGGLFLPGRREYAGEVLSEELVREHGDGGVLGVGAPSPPTVAAKVRLERRPLPLSSPTPPFILAAARWSHATAASSPRRCCAISRRRRRAPDAGPRRRLAPSSSPPRTTTVVPSCSSPSQRGVFGRR